MNDVTVPQAAPRADLPAIGAAFLSGIFAGISLHNDQAVALILLPGEQRCAWQQAMEWAEKEGGTLPSRIDQIVLFKNVRAEFEYAWYWSSEQRAGDPEYAWGAYFSSGLQYYDHKGSKYRARAVRRVSIQ